ncbi:MAG: T9SS type A sorting domain-containing protein [bacterium]
MKSFISIIALVITMTANTQAQSIQTRENFGALLEPVGRILHGAGQDPTAFDNYWNVMHAQSKPVIFMTYVSLKDIQSNWTDELKRNLFNYEGKFLIPQIGLSMTEDGNPSAHYEDDVAAGLYDDVIDNFIEGLRRLALPAFVRIGYEFNGVSWNGYEPDTYKSAFKRITNKIRNSDLEVATVWCFAMDGVMNYMDYYPGNSYVDWWAIDIFSANHFSDVNATNFVNDAATNNKPVMIGESTPRNVGVLNGQQSWNEWFVPYFNFIHTKPAVKAFCYINWNWAQFPQWSTWGDARLEQNAVVGTNFANEVDAAEYLHSSEESLFRSTLGYSDNIAPQVPSNLSLVSAGFQVELNWFPVVDPSGLSHCIIYKNGEFQGYSVDYFYQDNNILAGESIEYTVSAMDRAGNESALSSPLVVQVPNYIDKALNGSFEAGKQNWNLNVFDANADADFEIDAAAGNSAKVSINQSTGTNWHVQLSQSLDIHKNYKYRIQFSGKASSSKTIEYVLQETIAPYTIYFSKQAALTTTSKTFSDSVIINKDDFVKLEFFLGNCGTGDVWIDDVSIIESPKVIVDVEYDETNTPWDFKLFQNYPNPFNPTTTIKFSIPSGIETRHGASLQHVTLKIFDILGSEVTMLVNEPKEPGTYEVEFNASQLSSGVYFYRITAGNFIETKKLVFLK